MDDNIKCKGTLKNLPKSYELFLHYFILFKTKKKTHTYSKGTNSFIKKNNED